MKQLENVLLYIIPLFFVIKKKTYVQNQQQKLLNNSHLRRFDLWTQRQSSKMELFAKING